MTSAEADWSILASGTVVFTAISTLILAIYHFIFKKGRRSATEENSYNVINDRVTNLEQRYNDVVTDIKKYREDNSDKLDRIIANQTDLATSIAFIRGKLEGNHNHD